MVGGSLLAASWIVVMALRRVPLAAKLVGG